MKRGYIKTYVKTFFVILLIAIIGLGILYYMGNEYKGEQFETIKTDMLLIEGKTKIIAEKVKIKEKGASYVGRKIEKDSDIAYIKELQDKGIIDLNAKGTMYYILEQQNLEELGLSNIKLKEGYYIVEYNSNEIIYSKGIENKEGIRLYKLSEFIN